MSTFRESLSRPPFRWHLIAPMPFPTAAIVRDSLLKRLLIAIARNSVLLVLLRVHAVRPFFSLQGQGQSRNFSSRICATIWSSCCVARKLETLGVWLPQKGGAFASWLCHGFGSSLMQRWFSPFNAQKPWSVVYYCIS